jgi:L-methionine (R)-S-oxide reductase
MSGNPMTAAAAIAFEEVFTHLLFIMTESFSPNDLPEGKLDRYVEVAKMLSAVVAGEPNQTARYATCVSLLTQAFGTRFFWTGFYVVDAHKPTELVVGPYQGTLGCLRIPFGRGVCGAAAASGVTQLVEDVHAFPGHIACDSRSNSEIVVPVFGRDGALAAVLDVDSEAFAAFDHEDQTGLEAICGVLLTTP